ncbi:MAG: hypothetical protein HBSAPP04_11470 [Ignavibacteriaceae bacterium]|nr:MAG: hypothetical protein HBSAPP04_11470 [Ignavibacteriaceae bacterium]
MINRRDFLKLSGLAFVAMGSGVGVKKLFQQNSNRDITLAAMLPDDPQTIARVLGELTNEAGISLRPSRTLLMGESALLGKLRAAGLSTGKVADPEYVVSLSRIPDGNLSDIFIKTDEYDILSPETSFSASLKNLRTELKAKAASVMITLRPASKATTGGERFAVIASEGKDIERISLAGASKEIKVYGGNIIVAGAGRAFVKEHGCKHGICSRMGHAAIAGDVVACAPHKMTITIV